MKVIRFKNYTHKFQEVPEAYKIQKSPPVPDFANSDKCWERRLLDFGATYHLCSDLQGCSFMSIIQGWRGLCDDATAFGSLCSCK